MTITTKLSSSLSLSLSIPLNYRIETKLLVESTIKQQIHARLTVVAVRINGFHLNWIRRIGHDGHEDQIIRSIQFFLPCPKGYRTSSILTTHGLYINLCSERRGRHSFGYKLSAKWLMLEIVNKMAEILENDSISPFLHLFISPSVGHYSFIRHQTKKKHEQRRKIIVFFSSLNRVVKRKSTVCRNY